MPDEVLWVSRLKAWIRAVTSHDWRGPAGEKFNHGLAKISEFAKEDLQLPQHLRTTYDAAWIRAQGALMGEEAARALKAFEESESTKIDAALKKRASNAKLAQERASVHKIKAEAMKLRAEAKKAIAEAKKSEAEALKVQVDALLTLADRLKAINAVGWQDAEGAWHFTQAPPDTDWGLLSSHLVPTEALKELETKLLTEKDRPATSKTES